MGSVGDPGCRCRWAGILLSASLLTTTWSPAAVAQLTHQAVLSGTMKKTLAKPSVSVSQGNVTEHRGMTDFRCETTNTNVTIHWVSNNLPLVLNERMQLSADNKTLRILVVQREDAGTYQCEVWRALEVHRSESTLLVVNYGPDFVEIKLDSGVPNGDVVEVMEGTTLNFQVETQSYPTPAYSWYLPNNSLAYGTRGTFIFRNVSRRDEGMYRCLVTNGATQISRLGTLKVRILEQLTSPHIECSIPELVENISSVHLTCQSSHEGVGVSWFVKGQPLEPSEHLTLSSDNRTLVIRGLRRDDTGPYECEIWNWGSQARSKSLRLTINYGPDRVDITHGSAHGAVSTIQANVNSSLILQCRAQSKPDAGYRWTFDGSSAVHVGEELSIQALSRENQGIYTCTAANPVTRLALSASVLVQVVDSQESSLLYPGAIAGIVLGILAIAVLVITLGYFLYRDKDRWIRKRSADDPMPQDTLHASVMGNPSKPSPSKPRPVYDYVLERKEQVRRKEVLPADPPQQFYEKEPPSAPPQHSFSSPRKQALVPPVPTGNMESSYETLVDPDPSIYCRINPSF